MSTSWYQKGTRVISRGGTSEGVATGKVFDCKLSGCTGVKIQVRWPSKTTKQGYRHTSVCTKGLEEIEPGLLQLV